MMSASDQEPFAGKKKPELCENILRSIRRAGVLVGCPLCKQAVCYQGGRLAVNEKGDSGRTDSDPLWWTVCLDTEISHATW